MIFVKVSTRIWDGALAKAWRGDALAQAVAFYLMTSPRNTDLGIFKVEIWEIAGALGLSEGSPLQAPSKPLPRASATIWEALAKLEDLGFLRHDAEHDVVWIIRQARHNYPDPVTAADKRSRGFWRVLQPHAKSLIVKDFLGLYADHLSIEWRPDQPSPLQAPSKPLPDKGEAPCKPLGTDSESESDTEGDSDTDKDQNQCARADAHAGEGFGVSLTNGVEVGQSMLLEVAEVEASEGILRAAAAANRLGGRVKAVHDALEEGRAELYKLLDRPYRRAPPAKKHDDELRKIMAAQGDEGAEALRIAARNLALSSHHAGFNDRSAPDSPAFFLQLGYVLRDVDRYFQLCPSPDLEAFRRALASMVTRERAKARAGEMRDRMADQGEEPGQRRRYTLEEREELEREGA